MIPAHELVELERRLRGRRQHRPATLALIDEERLAVAAAHHLPPLAAAHEVIVPGIQREQRPHPPLGVHAQHHHVCILGGAHVHPHAVAAHERVVGIDPHLDRRVIRANCRGRGQGESNNEWDQHRALQSTQRFCLTSLLLRLLPYAFYYCNPVQLRKDHQRSGLPASGTNRLCPNRDRPNAPIRAWASGDTKKSAKARPPAVLTRGAFLGLTAMTW